MNQALRLQSGQILVALAKYGQVLEYSGVWWEDNIHTTPEYASKIVLEHSAACNRMICSNTGKYIVYSHDDGTLFVQDAETKIISPCPYLHVSTHITIIVTF